MKKTKFVPEFEDIPQERRTPRSLPLDERAGNFKEAELGFTEEMAIQEAKRCLSCRECLGCGLCLAECDPEAIVYDQKEEELKIEVGAIVLAPGFDEFDATLKKELGYRKFHNVISSVEMERILSPTGPYSGLPLRPWDGEIPRKIAFIQCVGSREEEIGANFCSSVCCMSAMKEAVSATKKRENLEATIFFTDIRTFGRGYEDYYQTVKKNPRIKFTRGKVSSIEEDPKTKNLVVNYSTNGATRKKEFDLVVLSVGLWAPKDAGDLSRKLGIGLNKYRFCATKTFAPLETSKPGVFVAGAFSEPKDISESVAQASGAACKAAGLFPSKDGKFRTKKREPGGRVVAGKPPRIGVFVCDYGMSITGAAGITEAIERARTLPGVAYVGQSSHLCFHKGQEEIRRKIEEEKLNRVVVVPCFPKTHSRLFENILTDGGLPPGLLHIVDADSMAQRSQKTAKTLKEAIEEAVKEAGVLKVKREPSTGITPAGLVIGGGISGMTAALGLADQGFDVSLVEREPELGGALKNTFYLLGEEDPQEQLKSIIQKVKDSKRIQVYLNTQIVGMEGKVGNFKTTLGKAESRKLKAEKPKESAPDAMEVEHGVVIVATGAKEYEPKEYLFGKDKRVITQRQLEKRLADNGPWTADLRSIVMIQCVGSRNKEHPYCSRVCCEQAIKNALKLKESNPDLKIHVLHRDMMAYGFREDYLTEAIESGVNFVRYSDSKKPRVTNKGKLKVSLNGAPKDKKKPLKADLLVLSTGLIPQEGSEAVGKMLGLQLGKDGFFRVPFQLRPLDTEAEGIFICGLAHSPKSIAESISEASGAAARASIILSGSVPR